MATLRYVGTGAWNRAMFDDKGVYTHSTPVQPGETVDFHDDVAKNILRAPRYNRCFVQAGGSEDHYGDKYEASRREAVSSTGNATAYPELDMGSTVTGGKAIFVTEDDNPEGFAVASPSEGPQSDNTEANINSKAEEAARKAREDERKKLTQPANKAQVRPQPAPDKR